MNFHNIGAKNLFVYGTRPELIKLAPVIKHTDSKTLVCTGQHRELIDGNILKPDRNLKIMVSGNDLNTLGYDLIRELSWVFGMYKPHRVVVCGDTATAFYAALTAFNAGIEVAHVEAGLRTWNIKQPFPEETYRQAISTMATLHFAPTERSARNLMKSGNMSYVKGTRGRWEKHKVYVTGNTIVDSVKETAPKPSDSKNILVTLHRRESNVRDYAQGLWTIIKDHDDYTFQMFIHPNTVGQELRERFELNPLKNIRIRKPVNYATFLEELASCHMLLTDSGGLQEEAATLGKPVVIMRKLTERPEVLAGVGKLAPTGERAVFLTNEILNNTELYDKTTQFPNPFGDGKAGKRIGEILNK